MTLEQLKILELIKAKIKRGDIQRIEELTGLSRQYISRCLSTEKDDYSETVVCTAVDVIAERKKKLQSSLNKIKNILE